MSLAMFGQKKYFSNVCCVAAAPMWATVWADRIRSWRYHHALLLEDQQLVVAVPAAGAHTILASLAQHTFSFRVHIWGLLGPGMLPLLNRLHHLINKPTDDRVSPLGLANSYTWKTPVPGCTTGGWATNSPMVPGGGVMVDMDDPS